MHASPPPPLRLLDLLSDDIDAQIVALGFIQGCDMTG